MRRPPPLPPPSTPAPARPQDDGHDRQDLDEVGDTAPVIPLAAPTPLPAAGIGADGGGEAADDDRSGGGGERVRLRDVWGAARARRRALRAEVRRFTVRQRRRRMLWIGVAASVVLVAVGTVAAAYSPLFAVEEVTIVGAEQLDATEVEAALGGQLGTPLPLVDESEVKAALVTFPLVESYRLEARPPHELVVRIVERTPIGLIETAAGYTLVDAAGVALSTTATPGGGRPLLEVEGGTASAAFDAVGQVMRSLPEPIRIQVTSVAASSPDDVTLTLGGTNTDVVWGGADQSAMKALALETAMQTWPPSGVRLYDVSSPSAIVIG
ncbi:hypothetical protein GCM10022200_02200 [Microbacterium awajiense]|uniref:POTRA domain-containing protein n=1 Tax=Microbacterium awajiense TaxID=415214 RepID=A0ABP7A290_9MICO